MTDHPIFHGILKVDDARLIDGKGRDVMTIEGGPQRLADCANALQDIWFPLAHVPAMENRIERLERLEQLRKEAVARIPEDGRYTDTPETANEAVERRTSEGSPQGEAEDAGVTGGESAANNSQPTPALPRLEPAGEATASPWRFDMENAPRGTVTITTRQGKDGPREVQVPKREIIIAASKCGKVTQSYWIPDADRWCMFTKDSPPVAWMAWPTHPGVSIDRAVAA